MAGFGLAGQGGCHAQLPANARPCGVYFFIVNLASFVAIRCWWIASMRCARPLDGHGPSGPLRWGRSSCCRNTLPLAPAAGRRRLPDAVAPDQVGSRVPLPQPSGDPGVDAIRASVACGSGGTGSIWSGTTTITGIIWTESNGSDTFDLERNLVPQSRPLREAVTAGAVQRVLPQWMGRGCSRFLSARTPDAPKMRAFIDFLVDQTAAHEDEISGATC